MTTTPEAMRFLPQPRIIAVDNNEDHLQKISDGLFSIGLPIVPILYDTAWGITRPDHWEPGKLRILFLDLNLFDMDLRQAEVSSIAEPIRDVLKSTAPVGPFIIIFWTSHKGKVDAVMQHIAERDEANNTPLPIHYTAIDKTPFIPIDGEFDLSELKKVVLSALNDSKLFLSLLAWESKTNQAASLTLTDLQNLVSQKQSNGTTLNPSDLADVLRNIAKEAWGKKRAQDQTGEAITSGLAPLLLDHLDSTLADEVYSTIWEEGIKGGWNRSLPDCASPAQLNAHCLIDRNCQSTPARGSWLEFSPKALSKHSIWKKHFGTNRITIQEEFINPPKGKDNIAIRNRVRLGLLECTAACDIANNKAPLMRYILCARIPTSVEKHIFWKNPDRYTRHDAIHRVERVAINGEEHLLYLDFRFVISLPPEHELLGEELINPIFRVRSQVLTDITSRYAAHTTRPGIYAFPTRWGDSPN